MSRRHMFIAVLTCTAVALAVYAAPILPANTLPPEVQSLVNLRKVELRIEPQSDLLNDEQLARDMTEVAAKIIREAGIEVVDAGDVPRVHVVVITTVNPAYPDAVTFTYHLSLEQTVAVERLNQSLFLPTYALVHGEMTSRQNVQEDVKRVLPLLMNHFVSRIHAANNAAGR